ncbi:MAG: HAD-IC family P-type ATPase [Candidatus Levybacteria bacterium]|nr:HAD-IC family P-type ATPase [Candidatus Levybacteria bacterium]
MLYTCPMDPEIIKEAPGECPKCGMDLVPLVKEEGGKGDKGGRGNKGKRGAEEDFRRRFFISLPLVFIVMLLSPNIQKWLGISLEFSGRDFLLFLLGTFIFFFGGAPFFKAAKGEIKTRNFGMMTLVAFAITVGYGFSVAATFLFPGESLYWEIATLISVFLLGHWLEMRAVRGATGALAELAKLIPPMAHKIIEDVRLTHAANDARHAFPLSSISAPSSLSERRSPKLKINSQDNSGSAFNSFASEKSSVASSFQIIDVHTEELAKGDRVLVRPGEKIPIDGVVIDGESEVNESMITGESRPVGKKKGDNVIGGSINSDGSLTVEVTKTGAETAISQIMKLIREAQGSKPNVQHLADRAANVLTFVAIAAGLGSFSYWFFVNPQGAVFAATLAVSAIVVACPHALGLAIPTVTTITSTLGAKNGILIKEMKGLEIARKINYVVFDKTGTLTKGEFGVSSIIVQGAGRLSRVTDDARRVQLKNQSVLPSSLSERRSPKAEFSSDTRSGSAFNSSVSGQAPIAINILRLAAAVEVHSQHSIAQGIVNEAKKKGIKIPEVKNFKSFPGKGASGIVEGKQVVVGNKTLMEELRITNYELRDQDIKGKTAVYVALRQAQGKQYQLAGVILLSDIVRDESKEAIDRLHKMGIKVAMLTGDTKDVAEDVGKELDIDTVFSQVLPEDKVNKIKELQNKGNIVAMVGDGVNDAPSLTQAHVGIAIGAGTDVAVESAEIVLMRNDPRDVVKAISLSRKTNTKMIQNLIWATGYNVFAIPTAAGVFYQNGILLRPEWAALLMSASSVIVVFNALLLRREKL